MSNAQYIPMTDATLNAILEATKSAPIVHFINGIVMTKEVALSDLFDAVFHGDSAESLNILCDIAKEYGATGMEMHEVMSDARLQARFA